MDKLVLVKIEGGGYLSKKKVFVSQERVPDFPEKGANLRGSPGNFRELPGKSGKLPGNL